MIADDINIIVNAACNLVIFISMLVFIIFCFGRSDSLIYRYGSAQAHCLKFGLVTICLGSLANLLTLSNPPFSEIILNIGLGTLFAWAAAFHYLVFIAKKQPGKKLTKAQLKKSFEASKVGSTWTFSLAVQIVNAALIGYLVYVSSLSDILPFWAISSLAVFFLSAQMWSFYAIFKTVRIKELFQKKAPAKKKAPTRRKRK